MQKQWIVVLARKKHCFCTVVLIVTLFITIKKNLGTYQSSFRADGGTWTHTRSPPQDFESCASAIPPHPHVWNVCPTTINILPSVICFVNTFSKLFYKKFVSSQITLFLYCISCSLFIFFNFMIAYLHSFFAIIVYFSLSYCKLLTFYNAFFIIAL